MHIIYQIRTHVRTGRPKSRAKLSQIARRVSMVAAYKGLRRAVMADVARYQYKPFDVAVCFLVLMFLPVPARRRLLSTLRGKLKPGRRDHRRGQGRVPRRLSGYGAVPADVGLQAQAGRGTGGGDAERAFIVRRAATPLPWRVGARRRGGVPVRGFCRMVNTIGLIENCLKCTIHLVQKKDNILFLFVNISGC